MSKKISTWAKAIFSIVVLVYIFYALDVDRFLYIIKSVKLNYIVLAVLVVLLNRVLMSYKWGLLLKINKIQLTLYNIVKIYFVSNFLSVLLLPTLGVDVLRSYYLKKYDYPLDSIFSSIIMERLIGFIVLLIFVVYGSFVFLSNSYNYLVIACLVFLMILLFWPFHSFFREENLQKFSSNSRYIKKIADFIIKILSAYRNYKNKKGVLLIFFLLTFIELLTSVLRSYIVALSFNLDIGFLYFLQFVPIVILVNRLPISINGFGLNEISYIYFLKNKGISAELAFSVGFVDHFCVLFAIMFGFLFYTSENLNGKDNIKKFYYRLK